MSGVIQNDPPLTAGEAARMRRIVHWIAVPAMFGFAGLVGIVVGLTHHNLALTLPLSALGSVALSALLVVSTHRDIDRLMQPEDASLTPHRVAATRADDDAVDSPVRPAPPSRTGDVNLRLADHRLDRAAKPVTVRPSLFGRVFYLLLWPGYGVWMLTVSFGAICLQQRAWYLVTAGVAMSLLAVYGLWRAVRLRIVVGPTSVTVGSLFRDRTVVLGPDVVAKLGEVDQLSLNMRGVVLSVGATRIPVYASVWVGHRKRQRLADAMQPACIEAHAHYLIPDEWQAKWPWRARRVRTPIA